MKLLSYSTNKPFDYWMIAWVQISPSIPSFNVKLAISRIFRLSTLGLLNCFLFIYLFICSCLDIVICNIFKLAMRYRQR